LSINILGRMHTNRTYDNLRNIVHPQVNLRNLAYVQSISIMIHFWALSGTYFIFCLCTFCMMHFLFCNSNTFLFHFLMSFTYALSFKLFFIIFTSQLSRMSSFCLLNHVVFFVWFLIFTFGTLSKFQIVMLIFGYTVF
jgi:hypothetical protein